MYINYNFANKGHVDWLKLSAIKSECVSPLKYQEKAPHGGRKDWSWIWKEEASHSDTIRSERKVPSQNWCPHYTVSSKSI